MLFELDRAELLGAKQTGLDTSRAAPRCDRRAVPADLAGDWAAPLRTAGYERTTPSIWFAEGVLFYLPEQVARAVLVTAADLAAPGSQMVVDLIGTGIFRFPYTPARKALGIG